LHFDGLLLVKMSLSFGVANVSAIVVVVVGDATGGCVGAMLVVAALL
jgi:hypothetical protein